MLNTNEGRRVGIVNSVDISGPVKIKNRDVRQEDIAAVDAWYWAHYHSLMLQGGAVDFRTHAYQISILQSTSRVKAYRKAAQMGFTELEVIRTLWGMVHGRYPKGVLYLFPTADDVSEFSKARFAPLIADNMQAIGKYVRDTDTASVKKIGRSMLYLRGARSTQKVEGIKKDSSKLRSIPVDKIVYDERDLMEYQMVEMAKQRFAHSSIKEETSLSTPTIPDYGIDVLYENSNQKIWVIKCPQCGKDVCLELEFPNCVIQKANGKYIRACPACSRELDPNAGKWVGRYGDREIDGYWISQLNSVFVDPGEILKAYLNPPNGDLQEVMNSMLGMPYISAENRLLHTDLYRIMTNDIMMMRHPGPTAMGVDVGNNFHISILDRPHESELRLVKAVNLKSNKMEDFTPIADLAKQYGTKCIVIDFAPVQRKVREFREAMQGSSIEVYGCIYQEYQRGPATWDAKEGIVRINRTEICDTTHDLVTKVGRLQLPRRNPDMDEYTKQMCNVAKTLEEDKTTGSKEYRYRKLGPDHYRHSLNYAVLAVSRVGVYVPESSVASTPEAKIARKRGRGSWKSR